MPLQVGGRWISTSAIVAAGGRGQRFGAGRPKQLVDIGGRSLLDWSLQALLQHPAVDEVIVALPAAVVAQPPSSLRTGSKPVRLVAGGARRQDSVANAFAAADPRADVILIHDAARPFVSAELIARSVAAAVEFGAAVAAVPSRDTVKLTDATGRVLETLPRERIYLAQTPQTFRREILRQAFALAPPEEEATDEATLAERAGFTVRVVEGDASNIKITVPEDMPMAEALIEARAPVAVPDPGWRVGTGYDLHRLVEGRPLILGGVTIPHDRGLLGHSDADAVCHAVTDALLGAAALGDIGRHFPDTDPQYAGAASLDLLARAVFLLEQQQFTIVNVDVVVIAQRPKLAPHVDDMRARLAGVLRIPMERVAIKGKTNESVDATGRGEAIATHAVALIQRTGQGRS